MKIDPITDTLIESVLPNNLISVEGEATLSTRIAPYLDEACHWLETMILGSLELSPEHQEIAARAALTRAVITAIPSLDLVVTPTGFGVVNTTNMSPASKERVERLIKQLSANLDDTLIRLQEICITYEEWRTSLPGRWYCGSFLASLRDTLPFRTDKDLFTTHSIVRGHVSTFERTLEEEYLGTPLITKLLTGYLDGTYDSAHPVISMIRAAATRYVAARCKSDPTRCPDPHETWHLARPILAKIESYPDLHQIWQQTMSSRFHVEPFRNTRPGGYFF